jgi:hypothetical protein
MATIVEILGQCLVVDFSSLWEVGRVALVRRPGDLRPKSYANHAEYRILSRRVNHFRTGDGGQKLGAERDSSTLTI